MLSTNNLPMGEGGIEAEFNLMISDLSWSDALNWYTYPVRLDGFSGKSCVEPGWFDFDIGSGDRTKTIQFENRFRLHAPSQWAAKGGELTFQTSKVIQRASEKGVTAEILWDRCSDYLNRDNQKAFCEFQKLLFKSGSIAIACTFPAFACPQRFPMVDTRIARYLAFEGPKLGFPDVPDIEKRLRGIARGRTVAFWRFATGHSFGLG